MDAGRGKTYSRDLSKLAWRAISSRWARWHHKAASEKPPTSTQTFRWLGFPSNVEWSSREIDLKPFQDYASRIKTFTWKSGTQNNLTVSTIQSVFRELGSTAVLLPKLRVLHWKMPRDDLLPLATRLPGENLEKLVLYHNATPVVVKTLKELRLSSRLCNLESLQIGVPMSKELGDEMAQVLQGTKSLHRLYYVFSSIPLLVVQALAERQTLTHAEFGVVAKDLLELQALAIGNAFSNLITLTLRLDTLAEGTLALLGNISSPRLKALSVEVEDCPTADTVRRHLECLVKTRFIRELVELKWVMGQFACSRDQMHTPQKRRELLITPCTLEPLLHMGRLKHLVVKGRHLALDMPFLECLSVAVPDIIELHFKHFSLYARHGETACTFFKLSDVQFLRDRCHHLRVVGLNLVDYEGWREVRVRN
ncbi:hypothetical protein BKA93DRAFT_217748 [Sparassis latifolia]